MFRKEVKSIGELILKNLRAQGLETPLLQKRLIEAWPVVAGPTVMRYTRETVIRNQTLYVRLSSPALRAELSMCRQELVKKLNDAVGAKAIQDCRILG